jgi:Fic family protein
MTQDGLKDFIHNSNLIEEIDSPIEDQQSYEAWLVLDSEPKKLSNSLICEVQKLITTNDQALLASQKGYYRDYSSYEVQIGGQSAPHSQLIPFLMDNWILDYADPRQEFDPQEAHIRFEHIHPFADGNGRTGRMLLNWHRLRKGLPLLVIPATTKYKDYYKWFEK